MFLERRSSWRTTMSPALTLPDHFFGCETSWRFFNSRNYSFSLSSKNCLPFFVSFGMPSLDFYPSAFMFQSVTLSIFRRRGNELLTMRPRCTWLRASNSERLQYWREWWPTLRLSLVTAPTHLLGIFWWGLPNCASVSPSLLTGSLRTPHQYTISPLERESLWGSFRLQGSSSYRGTLYYRQRWLLPSITDKWRSLTCVGASRKGKVLCYRPIFFLSRMSEK
jgi:hypothetical protein